MSSPSALGQIWPVREPPCAISACGESGWRLVDDWGTEAVSDEWTHRCGWTDSRVHVTGLRARIREFIAHGVTRAVAVTLLTQAISWSLALLVTFYLPSYLGVLNLGRISLATAFAGTVTALVSLGTSNVLIAEISKAPQNATALVRTSLALRTAVAGVLVCLAAPVAWLMNFGAEVNLLIALVLPAYVLNQVTESYLAALTGLQEFVKLNGIALIEKVTYSVMVIALVLVKAPLWNFAAAYIVCNGTSALVARRALLYAARVATPSTTAIAVPNAKELAKAGMPFLSSKVFSLIYGEGSTALLMSKLSTVEAIGWLGLAKRFFGAAFVIPLAISNSTLPALTRVYHDGDRARFARLAWMLIGTVILAALPIAIVLGIFPEFLLRVLRYPPSFAGSIPVLQIMGVVVFLWFTQQALATSLIAAGKHKVFGYVTSVAALLAFPVCGVCIWAGEKYLGNGAVGAMLGDTILEVVMLAFYIRALIPDLFPRPAAAAPAA